jgi:uncharacterized membrane protein YebE (DUF533 family)
MFDAKNLLNMLMGAGQQAGAQGGLQGGLGGVVGQVLSGLQSAGQQGAQGAQAGMGGLQGGLGGMVGQVLSGLQNAGQQGAQNVQAGVDQAGQTVQNAAGTAQGGLNDIIANAQNALQTGNMAGLAEQAKALLQNNAGGLVAGGLAGLALGSSTGRSLLGNAAKLGGLALVGGLAYKAYQNYAAGRPLASMGTPVEAAPQGSGFAEGDADDNERALIMVRSMIAAAAADGIIDNEERSRIIGNLQQAGLDDEAAHFIEQEFATPAGLDGLISLATTPELAAQVYTAARLAIDPDTAVERSFLTELAHGLALDPQLVAHINAAAQSVVGQLPE